MGSIVRAVLRLFFPMYYFTRLQTRPRELFKQINMRDQIETGFYELTDQTEINRPDRNGIS